MNLPTYGEWSPTGFDARGAFLDNRREWLVCPVVRTRDSGPLADWNVETALEMLGGESDDVELHRFGHWGPGWFEIIIVRPGTKAADTADEIQRSLAYYPVLGSEDDYSQRQWDRAHEYWERISISERVEWCQRYDASVFAARRDEVPECPTGELIDALSE